MKRRNPALIELILVILFFSLSSVVLVELFVKAKTVSDTSQAQTRGVVVAQDLVEQWKGEPSWPEAVFTREEHWIEEIYSEEVRVFRTGSGEALDGNFGEDGAYRLEAVYWTSEESAGKMHHLRVTITRQRDEEVITELVAAKYQ